MQTNDGGSIEALGRADDLDDEETTRNGEKKERIRELMWLRISFCFYRGE